MFDSVPLKSVLDVVAEFEGLGGASLGLVAWELGEDESAVASAWLGAVRRGLIEFTGVDEVYREEMWRLTERGRQARETSETSRDRLQSD